MEANELVMRYSSGETDLSLAEAELSGASLPGVNLCGADLTRADLREADLSGADLSEANLSGANLSGANLSGADLYGANLSGTDLSGANLGGVDLMGTTLTDSTRLDAKWRLVWSIINEPGASRDLREADLRGADLREAELSGANLDRADLSGADLSEANLSEADLGEADLSGTDLDGANLRGAKVTEEQLALAKSLEGATMPDAEREWGLPAAELGAELAEAPFLEGKTFTPRAFAYIIDMAVLYGLSFGLGFVIPRVLGQAFAVRSVLYAMTLRESSVRLPELLLGLVISVLYFALFEWLYGATPGKMLLRMRVARVDGGRISLWAATVRGLLRLVDGFLFGMVAAGTMRPLLQQRLGDKAAKTIVTDSREPGLELRRGWRWAAAALVVFLVCAACLRAGLVEAYGWSQPAGDRYVEQAILANAQGDHVRSAELYEEAIDAGLTAERLPRAYFLLGNEYKLAGEIDKAIEAHRQSVELDPGFAAGWLGLGDDYLVLGDLDRALEFAERSVALAPNEAMMNMVMGAVLVSRGEAEQALPYLERAVVADPKLAAAYAWEAWAYTLLERDTEADAALEKARQLGYADWEELQGRIELHRAVQEQP